MRLVMCFSAEADLVAGAVLIAVGVDALRHARQAGRFLLASLPLLFGLHQLTEVFVWWGLEGRVSAGVFDHAVSLYLGIAFGVLPWLVPLGLAFIEPDVRRRRTMLALGLGGAVVAGLLLTPVARGAAGASDGGLYVAYHTGLTYGGQLAVAYVAVTCLPLILSSHRDLRVFGVLNGAAVGALAWLAMNSVISLWCGWAAVTSLVVAVHLRRSERPRRRVEPVAVRPHPVR